MYDSIVSSISFVDVVLAVIAVGALVAAALVMVLGVNWLLDFVGGARVVSKVDDGRVITTSYSDGSSIEVDRGDRSLFMDPDEAYEKWKRENGEA